MPMAIASCIISYSHLDWYPILTWTGILFSPGLVFLEALSAEPVSAWTLHWLVEQVLPAVCTPQL